MTNQEKAREFIRIFDSNERDQFNRCATLVMMLSIAVGITHSECLRRIRELSAQ